MDWDTARDSSVKTYQTAYLLLHCTLHLTACIVKNCVQVGVQLREWILFGQAASDNFVFDQTHALSQDIEVLARSGRQNLVQAIELHKGLDLGSFALLTNAADLLLCDPTVKIIKRVQIGVSGVDILAKDLLHREFEEIRATLLVLEQEINDLADGLIELRWLNDCKSLDLIHAYIHE